MRITLSALCAVVVLAAASTAGAHSAGPLDHYGCHADRRLGDYHCHRGEFAGRHFKSKAAMLDARRHPGATAPSTTVEDSKHPHEGKDITSWIPFFGKEEKDRRHRPPAGSTVVPRGIEQRLRTLKDLYEKGLITEDEYASKRKEILGEL